MVEFREIAAQNRQTLEDIAIQEYGAHEGVEMLLFDNADSLPDGLSTGLYNGMVLLIRKDTAVNEKRLVEIAAKGIEPATGLRSYPPPVGPDYNIDYNIDHNIAQ